MDRRGISSRCGARRRGFPQPESRTRRVGGCGDRGRRRPPVCCGEAEPGPPSHFLLHLPSFRRRVPSRIKPPFLRTADGWRSAGKTLKGRTWLWIRSLESLESRQLEGTNVARGPFWSPDGRSIAFFQSGRLRRVDADGGSIQTICETGSGFGGSWNKDGRIVFASEFGSGLTTVPASGGDAVPGDRSRHRARRRGPRLSLLSPGRNAFRLRRAQRRSGEDGRRVGRLFRHRQPGRSFGPIRRQSGRDPDTCFSRGRVCSLRNHSIRSA